MAFGIAGFPAATALLIVQGSVQPVWVSSSRLTSEAAIAAVLMLRTCA